MRLRNTTHRPYARTTATALAVMLALTAVFGAWSVDGIIGLSQDRALSSDEVLVGITRQTSDAATAITAGLVLAVCLVTLGLVLGIARRNPGSRYGAVVLFLLLGVVALASGLTGIAADPPARNAAYGLLCAVADFGVAGLLLAPATTHDFDLAEVEHRQRVIARVTARDRR